MPQGEAERLRAALSVPGATAVERQFGQTLVAQVSEWSSREALNKTGVVSWYETTGEL